MRQLKPGTVAPTCGEDNMVVNSVSLQDSSLEMSGAPWDLSRGGERRDPMRQLKSGTVAPRCGEAAPQPDSFS